MQLAPVILFVYNRPWHTLQTLRALKSNLLADQSLLYIYCEGSKIDATDEDLKVIEDVKTVVRKEEWCNEVIIVERTQNLGLAANVIDGITTVINKHDSIIVLEDDLITSPHFLTYCNEGLLLYKKSPNVYSINAYQFPLNIKESDTFLCPLATSSWGWATWKNKWDAFQPSLDYKDIIQKNKDLKLRFNFAGYDYASMLDNQNSWAIRWYYSVFLKNGVGLYPTRSLINNIGFDGSGVNCVLDINYNNVLQNTKIRILKKEDIDLHYYALLVDFMENNVIIKRESFSFKVKKLIKTIVFKN